LGNWGQPRYGLPNDPTIPGRRQPVMSLMDRTRGRRKGFRTLDKGREEIVRHVAAPYFLSLIYAAYLRLARPRISCLTAVMIANRRNLTFKCSATWDEEDIRSIVAYLRLLPPIAE